MIKRWKTLNRLSSPGSYVLRCAVPVPDLLPVYSFSTLAWPHAVQAPKHLSVCMKKETPGTDMVDLYLHFLNSGH